MSPRIFLALALLLPACADDGDDGDDGDDIAEDGGGESSSGGDEPEPIVRPDLLGSYIGELDVPQAEITIDYIENEFAEGGADFHVGIVAPNSELAWGGGTRGANGKDIADDGTFSVELEPLSDSSGTMLVSGEFSDDRSASGEWALGDASGTWSAEPR